MTEIERIRLAAFAASGEKSYPPLLEKHNGRYNKRSSEASTTEETFQSTNEKRPGVTRAAEAQRDESAITEAIAAAVALGIPRKDAARLARTAPPGTAGQIVSYILRNR